MLRLVLQVILAGMLIRRKTRLEPRMKRSRMAMRAMRTRIVRVRIVRTRIRTIFKQSYSR